MKNKGGFIMKVAVPTIGGLLDEFFYSCEVFTIFTIDENDTIVDVELLYTPESCDCKNNIPLTMQQKGVTIMLANIVPEHTEGSCSKYGITVYLGYTGYVRDVVQAFLKRQMVVN